MSRCFPFPPPGYESRPRSEERHKDFLRKEKHKDKKHRKAKDRGKGEINQKDRDHRKDKHKRKHKRAKCGERKRNEDIYKDRNQTLRHKKSEENGQHDSVKDIIQADELVSQIFGQGDHTDHKYNKATEDNYGMVQKSGSIAHANKKGMGRGIDSKTEIKNGKRLQNRSAEMHSRRWYNCNGDGLCHGRVTPNPNIFQKMEETGQDPDMCVHSANMKNNRSSTKGIREENQSVNNFRRRIDRQFARNKDGLVQGKAKGNCRKGLEGKDTDSVVKKRKTECKNNEKEVKKNGTVNVQKHKDLGALGASEDKVDNLVHLGCLNEQNFAADIRKMKDFYPNNFRHGQHVHQHSYNNGITGYRYSEEQMPSVSSSGYESNKGYLKQPHPDTNYLSQVHCIPSPQDFSEYIDQDWLFFVDHVRRKTVRLEAVELPQVWSDAQLIDTADVIARPYVVPL